MNLLGIPLRKPSFDELTAAAVMGAGLWIAGIGVWHASGGTIDRAEAGAALLVVMWGCVATRLGVRLDEGGRHLSAYLAVNAGLLVLYRAACLLVG